MILCGMGCICNSNGGLLQSLIPPQITSHKQSNLQVNRCGSINWVYANPCYKLSTQRPSYSYSGLGIRRMVSTRRSRTITADGGKNMAVVVSAISVPVLLVLITVIVSIIISEKLDREFEEETARRHSWMKRRGIEEDGLDGTKEEAERILSPARNRPRREE
ncbi:uncharacterized protein LOC131075628 [Cryptomeria japonica]|uniref:uncharacterized protein LOC131075628 n=1 Tax=Cryptomeria japonica TaxID=3369 RepID=UPI0025ACDCCF|nr:uncharacterized protein LOC131075628 [Cryptomeria japonica]